MFAAMLLGIVTAASIAVKKRRAEGQENTAVWGVVPGALSAVAVLIMVASLLFADFSARYKASTADYAEFNNKAGKIRFELPDGWRTYYDMVRNPFYFPAGSIEDEQGRQRLNVSARILFSQSEAMRLEEFVRRKTVGLEEAAIEAQRLEFLNTSTGRCWLCRQTHWVDVHGFENQPVLRVEYVQQRGNHLVHFEFDMLAEEVEELETLTLQFVTNAQVTIP